MRLGKRLVDPQTEVFLICRPDSYKLFITFFTDMVSDTSYLIGAVFSWRKINGDFFYILDQFIKIRILLYIGKPQYTLINIFLPDVRICFKMFFKNIG